DLGDRGGARRVGHLLVDGRPPGTDRAAALSSLPGVGRPRRPALPPLRRAAAFVALALTPRARPVALAPAEQEPGDDAEEHGDEERDPQRDVPHPRDDEPDGGALRVLEDEHEEKSDEDQRADEAGADAPLLRRLAATAVEAGRHNRKRTRRSPRRGGSVIRGC